MTQQETEEAYYLEEEGGQPKVPLTAFDKISRLAFRIFRRPAARFSRLVPQLREDILKSGMRVTSDALISVAFLFTLIVGVVALAVVGLTIFYGLSPLILFVAIAPLPTFLIVLNAPKASQSSRASRLDNELPFVVGYMSILAGGGLSLLGILRRISKMSIFPAASYEARRILVDVDVYGLDPVSALEKAAKYSPSKPFTELLDGYTTVLRTGGDHVNYLNLVLRDTFQERAEKIRKTSDTTGLLGESFLIVVVVLGTTLFTLNLIETLTSSSTAGISNIFFFSFIIIPVISATFIWLLDGVQPKWPYTDMRPYKVFMYCVPVALAIFFIPIPIRLYLHLSLAFIALFAPATYFAMKYDRERRAIERMLPEFIRDVSEGRKIGLPPEGSIERLTDRNYGVLSKYVKRMGSQLSWGISLQRVIESFTNDVNSWIARAVGTLMLEVVDVGGGSVKDFAEMADFTRKISTTEAEKRSTLRQYIFVAYIGAIMVIATTFVMVYLLSPSSLAGFPKGVSQIQASPNTIDLLLTASIFQAAVIGIVAGKMGDSSIAEGFKHALFLVIISLVAIAIARSFITFPV